MALDAFYSLKEKKKKNIFDAIRTCLHDKNYDELSVGDIVKEADISRGSFYNYFVDKNDAVFTLIASGLMNKIEFFKESVQKNNGDIFEATVDLLENVKSSFDKEINARLVYNMKVYMNIVTRIIYSDKHSETVDELVKWLIANTTIGKEKIVDIKDMSNLLELLIATALNELVTTFIMTDKMRRYGNFRGKLEIIKNGICNKGADTNNVVVT